jgi:hypothetical protein
MGIAAARTKIPANTNVPNLLFIFPSSFLFISLVCKGDAGKEESFNMPKVQEKS